MRIKFAITFLFLFTVEAVLAQFHDSSIVIINADNLSRPELGKILMAINEQQPKAIGFDLFLKQSNGQENDSLLAASLRKMEHIVFAGAIERYGEYNIMSTSNPKFFGKGVKVGITKHTPDSNNIMSHTTIKSLLNRDTVYSFEFQLLSFLDSKKFDKLNRKYKVNQKVKIDYGKNLKKYKVVNGNEIIERKIDLALFRDKIILIGFVDQSNGCVDKFFSPFSINKKNPFYRTLPDISGIEIRANILSTLMDDNK